MKDNKLIAEFMGYEVKHGKCYSPKYNDGTIAPMQFDTSWDWLMPVVEKCLNLSDDTMLTQWSDVYESLPSCNINEVYEAVVKFIKYNKYDDGQG